MNPIFADIPTTIFETMSRLARETGAVNLGQGFPDDPGPLDVRRKAAEAVVDGWNQYPPMMGIPELRQAAAAHYRRFHGLDLDWEQEVMVTSGATEALADSLLALIEPGDEVVLFQPMYDAYLPLVKRAGGVPKFVTLKPPHWRLREEDLRAAFSKRTRVVLFNNPLNPSASVFPREDLELLGRFLVEFDAIAICDEVWEHVIFDGLRHQPLIGLPGLRERCIKIGSAGRRQMLAQFKDFIGFEQAQLIAFLQSPEPFRPAILQQHQGGIILQGFLVAGQGEIGAAIIGIGLPFVGLAQQVALAVQGRSILRIVAQETVDQADRVVHIAFREVNLQQRADHGDAEITGVEMFQQNAFGIFDLAGLQQHQCLFAGARHQQQAGKQRYRCRHQHHEEVQLHGAALAMRMRAPSVANCGRRSGNRPFSPTSTVSSARSPAAETMLARQLPGAKPRQRKSPRP